MQAVDERFRVLVECVQDYAIFLLEPDGRVASWNAGAQRLKGYRADEIIGRHFSCFYTRPDIDRRYPQYELQVATAEGRYEDEGWRVRKDGSLFWANVVITALRDDQGRLRGFAKVTRDLTERKQAEDALREANERLEERVRERTAELECANEALQQEIADRRRRERAQDFLVRASQVLASSLDYHVTLQSVCRLAVPEIADWCAVDVVDEDGRVQRVAVQHVDPVKVELAYEWKRRYPTDLNSSYGIPQVLRTGRAEYYPDITPDLLREVARDDEHLRLLRELGLRSAIVVPLVIRQRTLGTITLVTAESGRVYSDDDLALAQDLAQRASMAADNARLYQVLQEADQRKDQFLAMLAHELRNPLAPIRTAARVLREALGDSPHVRRTTEILERQVQHMARLVEHLLDASRLTHGKIELQVERVDLATVLGHAVETIRPYVEERQHELQVLLPPEPVWLDGDPARLEQVFGNLFHNAAKYTDPGGSLRLTVERDRESLLVKVRDTGRGISRELLPHVFELFTQDDRSLAHSEGGLGIGLALARGLVEMHGGAIEAFSAGPGQGSEFVVRLPAAGESRAMEAACPPAAELPMGALRILLVEDNLDAATALGDLLSLWGHDVTIIHEGLPAVRHALEARPDVVLLDLGLPGLDGLQVARRIRAGLGAGIGLVALTGYGQDEDRRRTAAAGFDHHLVKPVAPEDLQRLLADLGSGPPRAGVK